MITQDESIIDLSTTATMTSLVGYFEFAGHLSFLFTWN